MRRLTAFAARISSSASPVSPSRISREAASMSSAHRLDRAREVVVGREIAADELDDRLHLLADGREDELVAPHGVPAELALVRLDALGDEPPAALARPAGRATISGDLLGREGGPQLGVVADLVLHPPERLDRVPVAVRGGVLEPAEQRLVDAAAVLLHDRAQVQRRRQLGEVEHPVDLPVAIVDVDRVLEEAGDSARFIASRASSRASRKAKLRCISGTRRSRHQSAKSRP